MCTDCEAWTNSTFEFLTLLWIHNSCSLTHHQPISNTHEQAYFSRILHEHLLVIFCYTNGARCTSESSLIFWVLWRSKAAAHASIRNELLCSVRQYMAVILVAYDTLTSTHSLSRFISVMLRHTYTWSIKLYASANMFGCDVNANTCCFQTIVCCFNTCKFNSMKHSIHYSANISPVNAMNLWGMTMDVRTHIRWVLSPENHIEIFTNLLTFH